MRSFTAGFVRYRSIRCWRFNLACIGSAFGRGIELNWWIHNQGRDGKKGGWGWKKKSLRGEGKKGVGDIG
jgi:hypothetical protein